MSSGRDDGHDHDQERETDEERMAREYAREAIELAQMMAEAGELDDDFVIEWGRCAYEGCTREHPRDAGEDGEGGKLVRVEGVRAWCCDEHAAEMERREPQGCWHGVARMDDGTEVPFTANAQDDPETVAALTEMVGRVLSQIEEATRPCPTCDDGKERHGPECHCTCHGWLDRAPGRRGRILPPDYFTN